MNHHTPSRTSGARKLPRLTAALALVAAMTSLPARAAEPYDNKPPWDPSAAYSPLSVLFYPTGANAGGSGFNIASSTDVDYYIIGCSQENPAASPLFLDYVAINFTHSAGDLDIALATISGSDYIDFSTGTTNTERVTVWDDFGTVVLKIYGYAGATGSYQIEYRCRN